jgi:hypothetical protein
VEGVHETRRNGARDLLVSSSKNSEAGTQASNMGPVGYTVKLEQWEEEDKQLAAAGIPNPYDAYPDDRSKNWI